MKQLKSVKSAKSAKSLARTFIKQFTVACITVILPTGNYRIFVFQHGCRMLAQSGRADDLQYDLTEVLQNYPDAEVMEIELFRGDFWLSEVIE